SFNQNCLGQGKLSAISYQLSAISYQLSAISYQLSAISYQLSAISYQRLALRARFLRCYQLLNKTGKHCFNLSYIF
ncbi:MAG: hypothetical protein F6K38_40865, partial [Moorea sp. SIO3B2]|nr:hypothetical protein [Moorena sp. SIO3B2]